MKTDHDDLMEIQQRTCLAMGKILLMQFKGGASMQGLAKGFRLEVGDVEFLIRCVMVVKP